MPISRADFDRSNQVLFSAKIVHTNGWHVSLAEGGYWIGAGDIVDINKNGQADTTAQPDGIMRTRRMFTEPALAVPFQQIVDVTKAKNQGEVVTHDELMGVMVEDFGVSFGATAFQRDYLVHNNPRSIASIIAQVDPIDRDARCAIDVNTNEFMIYRPQAQKA